MSDLPVEESKGEYTPTLEAIAKVYSAAPIITEENRLGGRDIAHNRAAFHRALAAHDTELVRARDERIAELEARIQAGKNALYGHEDNSDVALDSILEALSGELSGGVPDAK